MADNDKIVIRQARVLRAVLGTSIHNDFNPVFGKEALEELGYSRHTRLQDVLVGELTRYEAHAVKQFEKGS